MSQEQRRYHTDDLGAIFLRANSTRPTDAITLRRVRVAKLRINGMDLVAIEVDEAGIARAKQIRAARDRRYRNFYQETATDWRWVGDLGELCVCDWLAAERIPYLWVAGEDVAGKGDFLVAGWSIDAKSVKRRVDVRSDYTAGLTARQQSDETDGYVFLSLNTVTNLMWVLGAIGKQRFNREAAHVSAGTAVHGSYRIRAGHAISNVVISALTPPDAWTAILMERIVAMKPKHVGQSFLPGLDPRS